MAPRSPESISISTRLWQATVQGEVLTGDGRIEILVLNGAEWRLVGYVYRSANERKRTPMSHNLSPFCVYTIRHQKDLDEAYRASGSGMFTENKVWKTGHRLFLEAQRNGQRMPVIFASADVTDKLRYHALLSNMELDETNYTTTYEFTHLVLWHSFYEG